MFAGLLPSDLVPFAGHSLWVVAFVASAHFLGFFIRGAFGFGAAVPIVLLTSWLLTPHHAIVLTMLTSLVAQVHLLPQGMRTADWPVFWTVTPGLLFGIFVGTWVLSELRADWLILVLSGLIATIVMLDRLKLIERLTRVLPLRSPWTASGLAAIGSTAGSISGGGTVYFLVVYLRMVCRSVEGLRGTNIAISGIFLFVRVAGVAMVGFVEQRYFAECLVLVPAVFLGSWAGTTLFRRLSPERFYTGLQMLLLAAACALAGKGLVAMFGG